MLTWTDTRHTGAEEERGDQGDHGHAPADQPRHHDTRAAGDEWWWGGAISLTTLVFLISFWLISLPHHKPEMEQNYEEISLLWGGQVWCDTGHETLSSDVWNLRHSV